MKYQADGWGLGYVIAGHYNLNTDWKLGFRYMSAADLEMKGTVEDHPQIKIATMKGKLKLPSSLTLGCANNSVENWIFSFDVLWTDWSRCQKLLIEPNSAGQTLGGLIADKNWVDTFSYRFGAEYRANPTWTWRAGYVYDNNPVPDTTRSFELPGSDGQIFSFGFTRKGKVWDFDFGYSYMMLKNIKAGTDTLNGIGNFNNGYNHFAGINLSRAF